MSVYAIKFAIGFAVGSIIGLAIGLKKFKRKKAYIKIKVDRSSYGRLRK